MGKFPPEVPWDTIRKILLNVKTGSITWGLLSDLAWCIGCITAMVAQSPVISAAPSPGHELLTSSEGPPLRLGLMLELEKMIAEHAPPAGMGNVPQDAGVATAATRLPPGTVKLLLAYLLKLLPSLLPLVL